MSIKFECKYFLGDRPCKFHKEKGSKCGSCKFYEKSGKKILLIKLGSLGDVLRTTFIARGLKEKYKHAQIHWLTLPECVGLLEKNPYIDRIFPYCLGSYTQLRITEFDLLVNLDVDTQSASLAALIKAKEKIGFGMDKNGKIIAFNSQAKEWLMMSLWDDLKKKNKKTYQELICEIVGVGIKERRPLLMLSEGERSFAQRFAKEKNINHHNGPLIGFNLEAGARWPKAWPKAHFLKLASILNKKLKTKVIIFRPPDSVLDERFAGLDFVVDSGVHADIRKFASLINIIDVLVSADTFALHVALAFGKKVVALFGPTSAREIDIFGNGEKIIAPLDCVGCYRNNCSKTPNRLESICPESVFAAIKRVS